MSNKKQSRVNWVKQWQRLFAAAGLSASLVGCSGNNIPEVPAVQKRSNLTNFSGTNACNDLETYIEDTAILQMRTQMESARDGVPSWGWWGGGFGRGFPESFDTLGANAGTQASSPPSTPTNFTQTNQHDTTPHSTFLFRCLVRDIVTVRVAVCSRAIR